MNEWTWREATVFFIKVAINSRGLLTVPLCIFRIEIMNKVKSYKDEKYRKISKSKLKFKVHFILKT